MIDAVLDLLRRVNGCSGGYGWRTRALPDRSMV
jgi:hypothetical protein